MNYKKLLTIIDKKYMKDPRAAAVQKKYQALDNFRTTFSTVLKIYFFVLWLLSFFIAVQVSGVTSAIATALVAGVAQVYWALRLIVVSIPADKLTPFFVKLYPAATLVLLLLCVAYFVVTLFYVSRILAAVVNLEQRN